MLVGYKNSVNIGDINRIKRKRLFNLLARPAGVNQNALVTRAYVITISLASAEKRNYLCHKITPKVCSKFNNSIKMKS